MKTLRLRTSSCPLIWLSGFGGPHSGIAGLRRRVGRPRHPLTCAAHQAARPAASRACRSDLPLRSRPHRFHQGRSCARRSGLFARSGSALSPAPPRLARAAAETGHPTRYVPNLSGNLDRLREQAAIARGEGLDTLLIAPMLVGLPAFHAISRDYPDMAFLAHPAMAGAARIAPPLLLGKLFRLFGADAVIFPHHGGRFGYSAATCEAIARLAREPLGALPPSHPCSGRRHDLGSAPRNSEILRRRHDDPDRRRPARAAGECDWHGARRGRYCGRAQSEIGLRVRER